MSNKRVICWIGVVSIKEMSGGIGHVRYRMVKCHVIFFFFFF